MDEDVPRVNTVFIRSRPVKGVGMPIRMSTPAPLASDKRPIGRWLPPVLLVMWVVLTILAPVAFWLIWFVLIPIAGFCWHFGFNDRHRSR